MQIDQNELTRVRLGLIDAQKFSATPYDYMVILIFIVVWPFLKIARYFNEVTWVH